MIVKKTKHRNVNIGQILVKCISVKLLTFSGS